ncbi:hypothetical protein GWI34_03370 [Actinomadura sp. DSM 109109]|nr:hypothetical protein [Actinomadura lepetitiana]
MSIKNAAVATNRSQPSKRRLATLALLGAVLLQGVGGALTTGSVPLAAATLIVLGGTPLLLLWTTVVYREVGLAMFSMGKIGSGERTTIFKTLRKGGISVDAAALRWAFVVLIGLTSLGINIGIAEADSIIGTGPRTAVQTLGTLLAGVLTFVVWQPRRWNQVVLRFVLFGSVVFAIALFSNGGNIEIRGLLWAGVVGFHMFMVQKALTVFGTEKFADTKKNEALSQRYRDIGMTLANCITLGLIVPWALLNHSFPTPSKFSGAELPVLALYIAIPLCVMVLPVLGMNWARNHLAETEQAMLTSTAPVWGAIAALSLSFAGWANTPDLGIGQWVGIVMVFLVALAAGIDVAVHAKLDQKDNELKLAWGEAEKANGERERAFGERDQANRLATAATDARDAAIRELSKVNAKLGESEAERRRLQAVLDALNAEAEPPAANGAGSVTYSGAAGIVGTPDGGIRIQYAGGVTVKKDDVLIETKGVHGAVVGNDGSFRGDLVSTGVVTSGAQVFEFQGGTAVQADPDGKYSIGSVYHGTSTSAQR